MSVLSSTLSRLYTPPTCTLEVTAQTSALSRWTRTPMLKSLDFLLSFDSLSQSGAEPLTLRGNQAQLTDLSEAVTTYLQYLLASPPDALPLNSTTATVEAVTPAAAADPAAVTLRPRTLLTHELWLGTLATAESGPSLVLRVSQLYDLATALETCAADLQQMPSLLAAERAPALFPLLRNAAAVIVAVGLGTAAWQLFQTSPTVVQRTAPDPAPAAAPSGTPLPSSSLLSPRPLPPDLKFPSVQLPSRTPNPSIVARAGQDAATPPEQRTPAAQSSVSPQNPASIPSTARSKSTESSARLPSPEVQPSAADPSREMATAPGESMGAARSRSAAPGASEATPAAPGAAAGNTASLFDTIPQVAEVRDYVTQRWQPSPVPPKSLEYRLLINGNGTLGRVEPLGAIAQQYVDKVPLPALQSAFVSPSERGTPTTIRLVLRPDGTVQTFLEEP